MKAGVGADKQRRGRGGWPQSSGEGAELLGVGGKALELRPRFVATCFPIFRKDEITLSLLSPSNQKMFFPQWRDHGAESLWLPLEASSREQDL